MHTRYSLHVHWYTFTLPYRYIVFVLSIKIRTYNIIAFVQQNNAFEMVLRFRIQTFNNNYNGAIHLLIFWHVKLVIDNMFANFEWCRWTQGSALSKIQHFDQVRGTNRIRSFPRNVYWFLSWFKIVWCGLDRRAIALYSRWKSWNENIIILYNKSLVYYFSVND